MADENTIYDENEATQFDDSTTSATGGATQTENPATEGRATETKRKGAWQKVSIGFGTGLVFGAAATVLTSSTAAEGTAPTASTGEDEPNTTTSEQHPLVDDQISMATCVDDDMSFSQAFAAARAEVGPGGAFEWRGQIYGTYTAEEWDNMSAAERNEYNDHFAWSSSADTTTSTDHHTASASASNDDVQVVSPETAQDTHTVHTPDQTESGDVAPADEVVVVNHTEPADSEVQVLGVVHDTETGMNVGGMMVDNQEVILIDVDNDHHFDLMATDLNGDGQFQENEVVDISGQGLTVNDLGGFSDLNGNMMASNDEPDYTNDVSYDA